MKTYILILITGLFSSTALWAQNAHFTTSGTIVYEKRVNMYALFKKRIDKDNESYMQPAYEAYKKNQPQFKALLSTLTFTANKTLQVPAPPVETVNNSWFNNDPSANQNNTTFTDLSTNTSVASKTVFDQVFLVKDTTRKINWKITDETRDIAGYTCRRANALVMDSIYVVAFYSTEIPVSGGPESFTGLPGMILGVALPHENLTWFATKVTDLPVAETSLKVPSKGKPVDNKTLAATLTKALKDWGEEAKLYYKIFLL